MGHETYGGSYVGRDLIQGGLSKHFPLFYLLSIYIRKMGITHLLFSLLVIVLTVPSTTPATCGTFQGATLQYDLSSLTTVNAWTGVAEYTYYWNFCENLVGVPGLLEPTTVLQLSQTGNPSIVGLLQGYEISERAPNVVSLKYIAGRPQDLCARTIARNTTITVECSPGSNGAVVSITEPSMCRYEIVMKHKAACGTAIAPTAPPSLPLCCVYNYNGAISTFCTVDSKCPELKDLKLEGQFRVDTCASCKQGLTV